MPCAASGTWQEPPRARLTARSAPVAQRMSSSLMKASNSSRSLRSARTSMPKAPWPGAGRLVSTGKSSRIRSSSFKRLRPAPAITSASNSPLSSLDRRVPTLPRIGRTVRCGNSERSISSRRKLAVPTRAPAGISSRRSYLGLTNASRGSSRELTAASVKPSGNTMGTSLSECTAKSAVPSSIAASSSLTNNPLPPILESVLSRI